MKIFLTHTRCHECNAPLEFIYGALEHPFDDFCPYSNRQFHAPTIEVEE